MDILGMMKQATQLKAKMEEMQAELDQITVEGVAGGGMVVVTLSAKGDMKGVKIDPSLAATVRQATVASNVEGSGLLKLTTPRISGGLSFLIGFRS